MVWRVRAPGAQLGFGFGVAIDDVHGVLLLLIGVIEDRMAVAFVLNESFTMVVMNL